MNTKHHPPRIGFACKISELDKNNNLISIPEYNFRTTTIAWLNRQSQNTAEEKLWELMKFNIESLKSAIKYVGKLEPSLRLYRIGSDLFPAFTESKWKYFWKLPDVVSYAERHLMEAGNLARNLDVRVSFHPGQFCVMASSDEKIVKNSIEEFEYHATIARYMGFGKQFQDMKINVHISGKQGPEGIRKAYKKLSTEARNCLTIENEEITYGLDDCLTISDIVPIVLDINHHWVREGEYIRSTDPRIAKVIDSWRGIRPVVHYSLPREDYLVGHSRESSPNLQVLLNAGHKKQKLRAHSDMMWNTSANTWAKEHWEWADVMVEAKFKNLASTKLYEFWKNT